MREIVMWCDRCHQHDIKTPGSPRPGYMVDGKPLDPPPDLCDDCDKLYGDPLRELLGIVETMGPAEGAIGARIGKKFFCKKCQLQFPRREIYLQHLKEHGDFVCRVQGCGQPAASAAGRAAHERSTHNYHHAA